MENKRKSCSIQKKRFPSWLKKRWPQDDSRTKEILDSLNLHTVCQSAHCPNRGECFSSGKATFMIMGNICTRNCRFCAVDGGKPLPLDSEEPGKVAEAASRLNLKYVVITSVTRDDLQDGGAGHFRDTILALNRLLPQVKVEILTPDFRGVLSSLKKVVIEGKPHVFNHNLETVPRLYPTVRPEADYQRSLKVLQSVKGLATDVFTKSGLMVGVGETKDEVLRVMEDLRQAGCEFITIGQYLSPSEKHLPVEEFVPPAVFEEYKQAGEEMGFLSVASAPFVRSSYNAEYQFKAQS